MRALIISFFLFNILYATVVSAEIAKRVEIYNQDAEKVVNQGEVLHVEQDGFVWHFLLVKYKKKIYQCTIYLAMNTKKPSFSCLTLD